MLVSNVIAITDRMIYSSMDLIEPVVSSRRLQRPIPLLSMKFSATWPLVTLLALFMGTRLCLVAPGSGGDGQSPASAFLMKRLGACAKVLAGSDLWRLLGMLCTLCGPRVIKGCTARCPECDTGRCRRQQHDDSCHWCDTCGYSDGDPPDTSEHLIALEQALWVSFR